MLSSSFGSMQYKWNETEGVLAYHKGNNTMMGIHLPEEKLRKITHFLCVFTKGRPKPLRGGVHVQESYAGYTTEILR